MSANDETIEALSIGAIGGGATVNRAWERAILAAMGRVSDLCNQYSSPKFNVNVVFHIPGEVLSPEFEGLRSGKFSRKHRALMVQVAIPEGEPKGHPDEEVRRLLHEAIDLAEDFARMEAVIGENERLDELRAIVSAL